MLALYPYVIFSVDNIIQHTEGKVPSGRSEGPTKKTIAQLEEAIKTASEVAVPAYGKAICTLKDYMEQVDIVSLMYIFKILFKLFNFFNYLVSRSLTVPLKCTTHKHGAFCAKEVKQKLNA